MISKIEQERYDRNSPSVHKVCDELGFTLSSGCLDWNIYMGKRRDSTVVIPDDFMAYLALMFGQQWDFGYQYRDENLKESIRFLKGNIKIVSEQSAIEKIVKKINIIDKELQINIDSLKEMNKKEIKEYKEKIKNLEFILETRKRLREYQEEIK